jgi:hypothetical protein
LRFPEEFMACRARNVNGGGALSPVMAVSQAPAAQDLGHLGRTVRRIRQLADESFLPMTNAVWLSGFSGWEEQNAHNSLDG